MASLYLRGQTWWISFYPYPGAKLKQHSLKTRDKTVAKYKQNEIENKIARGDSPVLKKEVPLFEVYTDFLSHCRGTVKPATLQYYKDLLVPFLKSLPPDTRIHKVRSETIDQYINARIAKSNVQPGMVWHMLKVLKTFFNFAVREHYVTENPVKRKKPRLPKRIPECWSDEEIHKILALSKGTMAGEMIRFNLYIGLRPAEMLRLQWSDIDWGKELLTVQEAKDNEFRKINLHPEALKILKRLGPGEGQVFKGMTEWCLDKAARHIKKTGNLRHIKKFWYAIRHTFATRYYEKTRDLRGLQEILGHSKIDMTTVYANPSESHRRGQIRKLKYDSLQ